jgi:transposase
MAADGMWVAPRNQEEAVMDVTTVAVDLAKDSFEVVMATATRRIVSRRRLTRAQFERFLAELAPGTALVMEACGTAHHWARYGQARGLQARLLPSQYVRPYVRRNKTDRCDAEALLEAASCGGIQSVPVKTPEQQSIQALHRVRTQWQGARTARINVVRSLLAEHGISIRRGAAAALHAIPALLDETDRIPSYLREVLRRVYEEIRLLEARVREVERLLRAIAAQHPIAPRLQQVPGIGVLTATACVGSVGHIHAFRRSRQFASWVGLTPREFSSGRRRHLGRISKCGDAYLRCLLIHGARSVIVAAQRTARARPEQLTRLQQWAIALVQRRGHNTATVALANKLARILWAVWHGDVDFAPRLR